MTWLKCLVPKSTSLVATVGSSGRLLVSLLRALADPGLPLRISLKKQHGLQAKFADEWGVSVKEATAWYTCKPGRRLKRPASKHAVDDSWKHDVVEDGDVHPHPGPSWRVVSLNVGGMPGAWRAVRELLVPSDLAVLALQEVAGSTNELISLQRAALNLGYRLPVLS